MRYLLGIFIALLVGCQTTKQTTQTTSLVLETPAELKWEQYPDGQKWSIILDKKNDNSWIVEKVPESRNKNDLSDLLVAQHFRGQNKISAKKFAKNMIGEAKNSCNGLRTGGPKISNENGYEVAHLQVWCGERIGTDYGTHTYMKILKNNDSIFVVTREFRVPPSKVAGIVEGDRESVINFQNKVLTANKYLIDNVYLCGAHINDSRCLTTSN